MVAETVGCSDAVQGGISTLPFEKGLGEGVYDLIAVSRQVKMALRTSDQVLVNASYTCLYHLELASRTFIAVEHSVISRLTSQLDN